MKLLFILFFFVFGFSLFGQREYDTEIEPNSRPGIFYYLTWKTSNKPKPRKYDRVIVDIYYSGLQTRKNITKNSLSSLGFTTNFMNEFALNERNTVSIGTGLAITTSKSFLNQELIKDENDIIQCFPSVTESGYLKNSLRSTNINIPVEFRFKTRGWSHTKLHVGGRLGYQLTVKEKYFHSDDSRNYKTSLRSAAELLTYSMHVRMGIRNYALYASYNLNPLFKHEQSPKLNWFQFGISISLF